MTTPLLLLRAVQLGVQIGEMDLLTIGTINDMYTEIQNDENQGGVQHFDISGGFQPFLMQNCRN